MDIDGALSIQMGMVLRNQLNADYPSATFPRPILTKSRRKFVKAAEIYPQPKVGVGSPQTGNHGIRLLGL